MAIPLPDGRALRHRLIAFESYYNCHAEPFHWRYTKEHLDTYIGRLEEKGCWPPAARPTDRGRNSLTVH